MYRPRPIHILALLAALLIFVALPTVAFAGNPEVSIVDSIADDVSEDGSADESSDEEITESSDSPTVDTYSGGGDDSVPPPTDCSTGSDTSDSTSGKPEDSCTPIDECDDATTPDVDECVPPTVCDEVEGGGNADNDTVCGGGDTPDDPEVPIEPEPPITGGGESPDTSFARSAVGGGLPFTGHPLGWVMYGGAGLMMIGGILWFRARRAGSDA